MAKTKSTLASKGKTTTTVKRSTGKVKDDKKDSNPALERALAQIEKQYGSGSIMTMDGSHNLKIEGISTGALSLDIALGGRGLPKGRIIEIYGPESSGKTTLVKEYVKALKLDNIVTSPTFSIQSVYGNEEIFHYDIYNKTLDEFIALGLLEEFEKDGIHFVEWGDDRLLNILKEYGFDPMVITIEKKDDKREYKISA